MNYLDTEKEVKIFEFCGGDVLTFLNGQTTVDFLRIKNSTKLCGGRGLMVNHKGKIISPLSFYFYNPKKIILIFPSDCAKEAILSLDAHLISEDVIFNEVTDSYKYSLNLVSKKNFQEIATTNELAEDKIFVLNQENENLYLLRSDFKSTKYSLVETLGSSFVANKQAIDLDIKIESIWPQFGVDFQAGSLAIQYPFNDCISYYKGCFKGQEVLARAKYRGKIVKYFCKIESAKELTSNDFLKLGEPSVISACKKQALGVFRYGLEEYKYNEL